MGFIRKATIITTGGLARGVIKPNSKKERIANAEEKRLKGQKMQERAAIRQATAAERQAEAAERQAAALHARESVDGRWAAPTAVLPSSISETPDAPGMATAPTVSPPLVADELAKLADLKASGILTEEEFAAQKARLLNL